MNNQTCSHCGLVNFADAEICKRCGARLLMQYAAPLFENGSAGNFNSAGAPAVSRAPMNRSLRESLWENSGFRQIVFGLLWIAGGGLLTYYTHSVFYGAIIFGVISALKGTAGLFTETD